MSEPGWTEPCRCTHPRCSGDITFPDHELPGHGFLMLEVECTDCGCWFQCNRNWLGTRAVHRDAERSGPCPSGRR